MSAKPKQLGLTTSQGGTWVQTDRSAHDKWAMLSISNPRAASVLHVLVAQMARHNAIVPSQATLAKAAGCGLNTFNPALTVIREQGWGEEIGRGARRDRVGPYVAISGRDGELKKKNKQ